MAVVEQSPQTIREALEDYLAEHPRCLIYEEGSLLFDLKEARYILSAEHNRCMLHLWSEDRNLVRRIVSIRPRKGSVELATLRFGQSKPKMLEVVSDPDRRTPTAREQTRVRFLPKVQRALKDAFPDWIVEDFATAMDLEKSFGPAYVRGTMYRGQQAWAVVAVNSEETPATIDGILTLGILWLHYRRGNVKGRRIVQGLRVIVPRGTASLTLARMKWLGGDTAQWELYEFDEAHNILTQRDLEDVGNLQMRLPHAPDIAAAQERFGDAVERVLALVPDRTQVEQRLRSSTYMAMLLHGLEFARIRFTVQPNSFERSIDITVGAGPNETPLSLETEADLREMLAKLFARRTAGGKRNDPLFRAQPERWLESMLRKDIAPLTAGSSSFAQFDPAHVYAQVPAFAASDHGMIDLLTVTREGRLVVLELKVNEDMHFALQALDYWVRVRWHHTQTIDQSTGLSALQQHGFFPSLRLQPQSPLLYLVAPSLRMHPTTETVLRYLKPEVEWTVLGLSEHWRREMQVIFRKRSSTQLS